MSAVTSVYCDPDRSFPGGEPVRSVASLPLLGAELDARPDTVLVVLGAGVDVAEALAFAAGQRVRRPALGVVLLRDELEVGVLADALRAGVREVAAAGDPAAVDAACARSRELSHRLAAAVPPAPAGPDGPAGSRIVTVFAGKGGVGKSTVATNLAATLADGGRRVLLVDLDLQFGDVGILLQLAPERTVADAVAVAGRLDADALASIVTAYRPGLDVLLAPTGPAEGDSVTRELVTELLTVARTAYDVIVVDTPPYVSDQVLAALDMTDRYVLVVTPDLPTLKSVRVTLDMFEMLQYPPERRLTLLNRADSQVGLTVADIERAVGLPMAVLMPSSRDVPVSVNRGVPLVLDRPGHPVAVALLGLAELCVGGSTVPAARPRWRLFGGRKVTR